MLPTYRSLRRPVRGRRESGDDPLQISRMTEEGMGWEGSQNARQRRRVLGIIRQSASSFPECVLGPVAIKEFGFCEAVGKCVEYSRGDSLRQARQERRRSLP